MRIILTLSLLLIVVSSGHSAPEFDRPFIFGTQAINEGRFDEMLGGLRAHGGTQSRVGVCWYNNEKERGQAYDFSETDKEVDLHLKHGFSVVLNLATVPLWASEADPETVRILKERGHEHLSGTLMISPRYMDDYVRWVEAVAKHFGDRIDYYEIWNEPDGMAGPVPVYDENGKVKDVRYGGDPTDFARVLKAAYPALHRADPGCTVIACSLESKTRFLRGIYEAGGKGYFDAVAIHPYGDPLNRKWIQEVRDLMVEYGDGDKGIWVTEYGWGYGSRPGMVTEAIRWGRETPYLTALHIHLANHLFRPYKDDPGPLKPGAGLIALRSARNETGPRSSVHYDFEGFCPTEWRLTSDQMEGSQFGCTSGSAASGMRALRAHTNGTTVNLICNAYVKDDNSVLTFKRSIRSGDAGGKAKISITTEPATPIYGATKTMVIEADADTTGEWTTTAVKLTDIDPSLSGRTLMNVTVTVESSTPGVTVMLDDVSITPGRTSSSTGSASVTFLIRSILGRSPTSPTIRLRGANGWTTPRLHWQYGQWSLQDIKPEKYRLSVECSDYHTYTTDLDLTTPTDQPLEIRLNPRANMAANPGFEEKGNGGPKQDQVGVGARWETICGGAHPEIYEITSMERHSGERSQQMGTKGYNIDFSTDPSRCFHLDGSGNKAYHPVPGMLLANQAIAQIIEKPVIPGEEYQLSAWVKISQLMGSWEWFRLGIYWLDKDGRFISEIRESEENKRNTGSHDWKLITASGVAPQGAAKAKVYLHHHFETGTVWYDDVCFARVSDLPIM